MAENLGAIRYDVEVGTADMLKAETVVDKSTTNIANDFKKIDAAAKNTNTQMTKAAAGVKKGVQANLGQAGIQVQQFVGQLQGGQSAMVALAQQSADLGIVLGAPLIGVFVSLAAVLAGTLAPAIFGSVSNLEKLEKAIENTKAVMTVGKNGIAEYTEEMKQLETASANLAKIKISLAITENNRALKESSKEFKALRADLFNFQEDSSEAAERLTGMTDKTGDVLDLASSLQAFSNAITDEDKLRNLDSIEKTLLSMRNEDGSFPTKELAEFAQNFFSISDATRQVIASNKALNESNAEMSSQVENNGEAFKDLRISMREQIIALEQGERAAYKYSLLMSGNFTPEQIRAAMKLYDTRQELIKNKEETEEATKANEKYEASIRKRTESDLEWLKNQERIQANKDKKETATLTTQVQSIGLTPLEEIQARYDQELELLNQAEEQKIEIEGSYADRRLQIEAEKQEAIRNMQTETNQFMEDAFGNLDTQIAGTMAQVVVGAKDGEDAMRSLANTMLTQVVGALVQQGVELIKNKVLGNVLATSEKANILSTTATGIAAQQTATTSTAAAAATTATAAAPAAALTSTFSFGSAAVIGGAALLGTLAIAKMMGGRQYGGPVSSGMYRVNETGVPEIYSQGGKDYLMNTKNANIKPLDKASGGGGGMTVNVSNNTPYEVYVTQDQAASIANVQIGKESKLAAKGRGNMFKALSSSSNLRNQANRG